jgi:alpha-mannosidase
MWVEADCNVTGGESLVRQFLVGKAAAAEMLGYEGDTLWLPDVFGYAAALPQILAGCGIDYFVTSKINWNDTTRFPYDTFLWRGIDGTAVKTHYISSRAEGYNGRVSPRSLAEIWKEIQHKELQSAAIKSIGEGDGGGGTARADLEQARRLGNLEGAPKAGWSKVSDALKRIFSEHDEWPVWRGELYLELHRGTYTTQARTKRYNRKLEFALRNAEFLSVFLRELDGAPYPAAELLSAWKSVLTNQFHDIIPGSSIGRVYEEAEAEYRKVESSLGSIASRARERIASRIRADLVLFNDLSWERRDAFTLPAAALAEAGFIPPDASSGALAAVGRGEAFPIQFYVDLDGAETAAFSPRVPPLGWAAFSIQPAETAASPFVYRGGELETPFYRVRFDAAGRIEALLDRRRDRELVAAGGRFNALLSAEDVPVLWDAWDVDSDWTKSAVEETNLISSVVAADGPVCFRLRRTYRICGASALVQDVVFYASDPRIDFDTRVDWRESRRLLKTSFDTALDASKVRCEVQYGHVVRNAHRNLPSDRAQFEFCAHKWICMEEEGGGLALLNDCKYGHDAEGGRMRLSLLRSPAAPDPQADRGPQRFVYSILPFAGPFGASRVVGTGYELNDPCAAAFGGPCGGQDGAALPAVRSFCSADGDAVVVEAVKAAEAGAGSAVGRTVLRVYESLGGRARATLRFASELSGAWAVDLLERNPAPLGFEGNALPLDFRAFEIKTVIVEFRRGKTR